MYMIFISNFLPLGIVWVVYMYVYIHIYIYICISYFRNKGNADMPHIIPDII